jgi:1-aminocyclopropane-1-carboxylate deaminase
VTTPTEDLRLPILEKAGIRLSIRREDQIHPLLSGNKFRKLKFNIRAAQEQGCQTLLTFGGAYSNHIAATAFAARKHGLDSVGFIRGEELAETWKQNPTLAGAAEMGMQLVFVSREEYRQREREAYLQKIRARYKHVYILPEGGTNESGIRGCEEILQPGDNDFNVICCAVGTGGTLAGISRSAALHQKVLGFPALKGDFLEADIRKLGTVDNWSLATSYHFGGYGRVTAELVLFINKFRKETGISLDPVYTGKMMFGLLDMAGRGAFERGTHLLAIHTGGLQGIRGMNGILKKKNLPLLAV